MTVNMIILALDLSLNRSGWAVIDTSKKMKKSRLIDYGVISNKHLDSTKIGLKLYHIELVLKGILIAHNPDVIVIEELTGTGFGDSTKLARVHGVLEKLTIKFNNIVKINNKTLKKEFAGKGNAEKIDIENKVLEYFPDIKIRYDDESDSIALALLYTIKNGLCKW